MDQYEVLEQIGKGAFGSALLVRHKVEKKKYVLKKIRLARQTDRTRRSAHQEMQLIGTVSNPFIVEYKDSWVEKGCHVCIVIGYCEEGDMAEAIKRANGTHFSEEKLCNWLVQLLIALDYLHANHILHRDVKCSNIFLTRNQSIRLGDFGLAKILTSDDLASSVVGTPSYMCPELLADIPYGAKSDIWSLGCCIYEMTALKAAFKAFAADLLKHPHLQPYVMQLHSKPSSARNIFPPDQFPSDEVKKMMIPTESMCRSKTRRNSLGNERTMAFSKPCIGKNSISSVRGIKNNAAVQSAKEFSIDDNQVEERSSKTLTTRYSTKTPESTPVKTIRTPLEPPKASYRKTKQSEFLSKTPASRSAQPARRASLPLPSFQTFKHSTSILDQLEESPDVSINSPRIDRMAEFPLATSEEPLFKTRKPSSSTRSYHATPQFVNRSVTKDKCTIETFHADGDNRSDSSGQDGTPAPSRSSLESRERRFNTTSYRQRAEALEGVLEFSAQLLQQERYKELGVLLKPFGPEKVSPRETAIWLTKSFKETGL